MHEDFKTKRLELRPLTGADAADFAALVADRDICRMTGTFPHPFPKRSVEGLLDIFMARAVSGIAYHWAITRNGRFLGAVGIGKKQSGWSFGYWIGKPFWGQGFATEVVSALVKHLRKHDAKATILADVFTDNPASDRVLRKVGFTRSEQTGEGYSLARDKTVPVWTYTWNGSEKTAVAPETTQQDRRVPELVGNS